MWWFLGGVKTKTKPSQTNINWALKWKTLVVLGYLLEMKCYPGHNMGILKNHCKDPVINQQVWWKVNSCFFRESICWGCWFCLVLAQPRFGPYPDFRDSQGPGLGIQRCPKKTIRVTRFQGFWVSWCIFWYFFHLESSFNNIQSGFQLPVIVCWFSAGRGSTARELQLGLLCRGFLEFPFRVSGWFRGDVDPNPWRGSMGMNGIFTLS